MDASVWMDAWRGIVTAIDRAILNLIVALYDIMNSLATQQIFSEKTITDFATRIYTLLALIMIFKVTFSLITYLVNPDTIADKEAGAGNMAKNVVVMLILIIMVPYGFDFLYRAQGALIEDNFVANLIYGTNSNEVGVSSMYMSPVCKGIGSADIKDTGEFLAIATIRPFYQIDEKLTESGSDGTVSYNGAGEGVYDTISEYCSSYTINKLMSSKIYAKTTKRGILGFDRGFYVINYSTLLSTICCIVVLILMLTTCLDIALRVVKLGFLELIAPIPIISYIDPKSGKNGIFKKWVDAVIGTWATLFIKLAVVYFAIYTVSLVGEAFKNVQDDNNIWVMLFMVIGALMFAKQAPKLIEDIFGIKLDGMAFHPIKKIQEQAVGGKAVTGAVGAVGVGALSTLGGGAANLVNNFKNRDKLKEKGQWNFRNNLKSFGSGALYGGYHGIRTGYAAGKDGKFKWGSSTLSAIEKASADRNLNQALVENDASKAPFAKARFKMHDKFTDVIGYQGKGGTTDELKEKLRGIAAAKAEAQIAQKSAQETLDRFKASASGLFSDVLSGANSPFKRLDDTKSPSFDDDGKLIYNALQSYDDYIRNSNIEFKSNAEREQFKTEYTRYYNMEQTYRDASNVIRTQEKKEKKLTKQQDAFADAKKGSKS